MASGFIPTSSAKPWINMIYTHCTAIKEEILIEDPRFPQFSLFYVGQRFGKCFCSFLEQILSWKKVCSELVNKVYSYIHGKEKTGLLTATVVGTAYLNSFFLL